MNSCTSVLPNTYTCEQQEWNTTNTQLGEEHKERRLKMERSTAGMNKKKS